MVAIGNNEGDIDTKARIIETTQFINKVLL